MTCTEVQNAEAIERYLLGQLPDAELESFEQHYFACETCFKDLEAGRLVQASLASRAEEIRREPIPIRTRSTYPWIAGLAVAASLIIAVGIVWRTTQASLQQAANHPRVAHVPSKLPDYTELARVSPPVYNPPVLRSTLSPQEAAFRTAMQSYRAGDYAKAIEPLKASAAGDAAPHFYLAACYLLTAQPADAVTEFQRVLDLHDSRFDEEAHFLLAKAWLQQNRPDEARAELQKVAAQTGDFTKEAKALLAKLDAASPQP